MVRRRAGVMGGRELCRRPSTDLRRIADGLGALPASYEAAALPVVNVQLERAGIRLAAVLNAVLR